MVVTRTRYEELSILKAVESFLTTAGWTGITYTPGYQPEGTITNPQVSVTISPGNVTPLQLGRVADEDSLFTRTIVINAYMESEPRAQTIVDSIMDFMDLVCVDIKDPAGVVLGTLQVPNSQTILGAVLPPIMNMPKLMRYRGTVRGIYEAFYP